jgi:hypothetical protein
MAPRLLTLLAQIEKALAIQGSQAVASPVSRSVNFHKGLARITFSDGSGSIHLQNFTLADGQICVRAVFSWQGSADTGTLSVYPREAFDWQAAADQLAAAWLAGQSALAAQVSTPVEAAAPPSREQHVAATG